MRPPLGGKGRGKRKPPPPPAPVDRVATFTDTTGVDDMSRDIHVTFGDGTAAPDPDPPTGTLIWSSGFETNSLSTDFADASWNFVYTPFDIVSGSVPRTGTYCGRARILAGDSRCEVLPLNSVNNITEGDDYWFRWCIRLSSSVPLNTTNWQVFAQFKNDGVGSPPLALDINNGTWEFGGGYGWPGTDSPTTPKQEVRSLGAAVADVWEEFLFHIYFSDDPDVGTVNAWRNGTQMITDWKPIGGTLYPSLDSYVKLGYYRSTSIGVDSTVYLDDLRWGTTREIVEA